MNGAKIKAGFVVPLGLPSVAAQIFCPSLFIITKSTLGLSTRSTVLLSGLCAQRLQDAGAQTYMQTQATDATGNCAKVCFLVRPSGLFVLGYRTNLAYARSQNVPTQPPPNWIQTRLPEPKSVLVCFCSELSRRFCVLSSSKSRCWIANFRIGTLIVLT